MTRITSVLAAALLMLSAAGCSTSMGIFKAGVWVTVLLFVLIVVAVLWIVAVKRKGGKKDL